MGKTQKQMMWVWAASLASIVIYASVWWYARNDDSTATAPVWPWLPQVAGALIAAGLIVRVAWLKPLLNRGRRLKDDADRRRYRTAHGVAYWLVDMAGIGGLMFGLTGGAVEGTINLLAAAFIALLVMWPRTMEEVA